MVATKRIVLYDEENTQIIAEVMSGQKYFISDTVSVYVGSLINFLIENPQYADDNNIYSSYADDTPVPELTIDDL